MGRQAHPEGWSSLPQIQSQEELLAQGSWCCYEPCGASPRWWKPSAHWQGLHRLERSQRWKEGRSHRCQKNRKNQGRKGHWRDSANSHATNDFVMEDLPPLRATSTSSFH